MTGDPNEFSLLHPDSVLMLTPSDVLEYLFCPRFPYFMHCLGISQYEERRYKIRVGRELHRRRARQNPTYKRKRLGCKKRVTDVYLACPTLHMRGIVDEVLELEDGSLAPLDYKHTTARTRPFKTHRVQLGLYAMMIAATFERPVRKGFLVYTRGGNTVSEVLFSDRDFVKIRQIVQEVVEIIQTGALPGRSRSITRCADCCYRNVCV